MPTAKLKKSIAFAAVIAVVVSVISLAAISSEELQGAVRKKVISNPAPVTISVPPSSNLGVSITPYGYDSGNINLRQTRKYNSNCSYYAELGKWKMVVTGASLKLQRLPFFVRYYDNPGIVGTQFKVHISQNTTGLTPLHTFTGTSNSPLFNISAPGLGADIGVTLQPGTYYISIEALLSPSGSVYPNKNGSSSITATANVNNSIQNINGVLGYFNSNNQSINAELGQNVTVSGGNGNQGMAEFKLESASDNYGMCQKVADPGSLGDVGRVRFAGKTPYITNGKPLLYVSSVCSAVNTWEVLGQWTADVYSNHFFIERAKFEFETNNAGTNPTVPANDYRVFVSTDATNYQGTALAQGIGSSTTSEVSINLTNGALLESDWTLLGGGKRYTITLEFKPARNADAPMSPGVRANISHDPQFVWGTFGEGSYWEQPASIANGNIQQPTSASIDAPLGGARNISQNDENHPDPACRPAVDLGAPTAAFQNTLAINNVYAEACPGEGDWVAVHQATLNVGNPNRDLRLDFIPTQVKRVSGGGAISNELAGVKAVVSTSADYANSALGEYEYASAPFSYLRIPTGGLVLEGGNTYYVTYLVKKGTNYSIAPGGNLFGLQAKVSNQPTLSPYGVFSPGTENLAADNSNVPIAINTATNFYFQACQ